MFDEISINDILKFLESKNYIFSFHGDKDDVIKGYSTLFNYKEKTITFVSSLNKFSDYTDMFKEKRIQLIITDPSENINDCFINTIQVEKPKQAFFSILDQFYDSDSKDSTINEEPSTIDKHSIVSSNASIGDNVSIGFGCVIEENVVIGSNTIIHPNVVIRKNTKIGKNCTVFSGAIIGERGFNPFTLENGSRSMLKHYGGVTIEDDVHIGENSCVARGAIDDTIIKKGAKLNTMVHIAHNCVIGEHTVITMPTHICGSVIVGDNCHIAATTIRNQCKIGNNAVLGLGSVVIKDVASGTTVVGNPAKPLVK